MESVSTLLHLLCLLPALLLCGATEHYVRPTEPTNTTCPCQPCRTLNQYISDSDFLWSNTVLRFLSGTHQVNGQIKIENAHNVSLMAEGKSKETHVLVHMYPSRSQFVNMVFFSMSRNVTIENLSFKLSLAHDSNLTKPVLQLRFNDITRLYLNYNEVWSINSSLPCIIVLNRTRNVGISSLTTYYGGIYLFYTENTTITNVNTAYNTNMSTIQLVYIGIVLESATNTIIRKTVLRPKDSQKVRMGMSVQVIRSDNVKVADTTLSSSVSPFPNFLTTVDVERQPAVIELYDSNVTLRNCTFINNSITALKLVNTHIRVLGNLTFTGNRAYKGAAMILIESYIILIKDCYVTFKDNVADDTGGAIYIVPKTDYFHLPYALNRFQSLIDTLKYVPTTTECFLMVKGNKKNKRLIFINNSAGQGGDVLFGGSLRTTCTRKKKKVSCGKCLEDFKSSSLVTPDSLSAISSDPTRVCFCSNSNKPDYLTVSHAASPIYPGQTVKVSVIVVGHNKGSVVGSVFAQFLSDEASLQLVAGQYIQEVQQHGCKQLNYTIFSQVEEQYVTLVLTAKRRNPTQHVHTSEGDESQIIEKFKKNPDERLWKDILEFSVYLKIPILPCPPGFALTHKPPKCDCNKNLQLLQMVMCDIKHQEIQRRGLVWVGPLTDNSTIIDVMTSHNCPLNYCKYETLSITLNESEKQCNYNHSGILCGGCQPGLSLALGSPQCLKCSNKYLALIIPLTLAGLVLVFLIKMLDLTTSKGFINGLIFYANILKPNEHVFLHQTNINPLTLFITWLNLDLGIETCFVDGLTAYWKTWLQFVFPFYIWAIAGLIIISARYSTRLARVMGNNSVPVLATLFLLSYAKLLRTIITILSYTVVETPHGQKTVWSADGNIDYLGSQHTPLFAAAIATLLFLWLPYTLLLLLGQWLHKINHRYVTHLLMKIKPFLDAHYGPLKDKHHYWFGVLLCVRVIILLISAVVPANNFSVFTLSMSITAGALISFTSIGPAVALISFTSIGPAVYRNTAALIFEISLFINLGLLCLTKFYTYAAGGDQAAATYMLIGVAFIQFLGLVLYQIYSLLKLLFSHCHTHECDNEASENIWRYNTSVELSLPKWKTLDSDTSYQDAATTL